MQENTLRQPYDAEQSSNHIYTFETTLQPAKTNRTYIYHISKTTFQTTLPKPQKSRHATFRHLKTTFRISHEHRLNPYYVSTNFTIT